MTFKSFGWRNEAPAHEFYDIYQDNEQQNPVAEEHDPHSDIVESKLETAGIMAANKQPGEDIKLPLNDIEIDPCIDWPTEFRMAAGEHDLMFKEIIEEEIGKAAVFQVCKHTPSAAD